MNPEQLAARWLADVPRLTLDIDGALRPDPHGAWMPRADALAAIARHLAPGDDLVAQAGAIAAELWSVSAHDDPDRAEQLEVDAAHTITALLARLSALTAQVADVQREAGKMLAEQDHEYNRKTNDMIERHAKQTATLRARLARMEGALAHFATDETPDGWIAIAALTESPADDT